MDDQSMGTVPSGARDAQSIDLRDAVLLVAYAGCLLATVATVTGVAVLLASVTEGLGHFVLVVSGWLVVVGASPSLAERGAKRLVAIGFDRRTPRSPLPIAHPRLSPGEPPERREGYLGTDDEGTL